VTWNGHGLKAGDPVVFRTTGGLPTNVVAGTVYYVIATSLTANTFRFSATPGGSAVNSSGAQSGVHTGINAPFGDGDGTTTFNVPDLRGRATAGRDDMGDTSANRLTGQTNGVDGDVLGAAGGAETHALTAAQTPNNLINSGGDYQTNTDAGGAPPSASHTGTAAAHNNVQPTMILNKIIFAGV
jgi:microcystin-dependent protein